MRSPARAASAPDSEAAASGAREADSDRALAVRDPARAGSAARVGVRVRRDSDRDAAAAGRGSDGAGSDDCGPRRLRRVGRAGARAGAAGLGLSGPKGQLVKRSNSQLVK